MNRADLTRSQHKVLHFIEHFAKTEERSPTLKEIADGIGCTAVSTIHKHVFNLIEKGFLERQHGRGNNIVTCARRESGTGQSAPPLGGQHLGDPHSGVPDGSSKVFPFYGDVAAGVPLVPESYATPIELPHSIHRNKRDLFVLRVKGDSMMDDSILNGDLVVLQRRGEYRNGDRVVALIDREEVTLKELRKDSTGVWLIPHNPSLSPRHYGMDRVEVQGVLVGVMRSC
jgi:SOS regulatory protein LexA